MKATKTTNSLNRRVQFLEKLFRNVNGHSLSNEFQSQNTGHGSLTYGEVKYLEFAKILKKCQAGPGKVFYDLGSGTGKSCFVASLLFNVDKAVGVELVPGLSNAASQVKNSMSENLAKYKEKMHFINSDFTKIDVTDADIIFVNSTCMDQHLMDHVVEQSKKLKKGSYIVCLTKSLNSNHLELIFENSNVQFSWGAPTTRIYRKVT